LITLAAGSEQAVVSTVADDDGIDASAPLVARPVMFQNGGTHAMTKRSGSDDSSGK
jgi:hypothetical protein